MYDSFLKDAHFCDQKETINRYGFKIRELAQRFRDLEQLNRYALMDYLLLHFVLEISVIALLKNNNPREGK